jgi:hypothetical protein
LTCPCCESFIPAGFSRSEVLVTSRRKPPISKTNGGRCLQSDRCTEKTNTVSEVIGLKEAFVNHKR